MLNDFVIKGAITPPENQATLIFPIISDARFNCLDENLFI